MDNQFNDFIDYLLDDMTLLDEDAVYVLKSVETMADESVHLSFEDAPGVFAADLDWAMREVLGPFPESPPADETAFGRYQERLELLGRLECTYCVTQSTAPPVSIEQRQTRLAQERSLADSRRKLVTFLVQQGRRLGYSDETIEDDVVTARRSGWADAHRVVELAIKRHNDTL